MQAILVLDNIYYPVNIININIIKSWKPHWGTLILGNEMINPYIKNKQIKCRARKLQQLQKPQQQLQKLQALRILPVPQAPQAVLSLPAPQPMPVLLSMQSMLSKPALLSMPALLSLRLTWSMPSKQLILLAGPVLNNKSLCIRYDNTHDYAMKVKIHLNLAVKAFKKKVLMNIKTFLTRGNIRKRFAKLINNRMIKKLLWTVSLSKSAIRLKRFENVNILHKALLISRFIFTLSPENLQKQDPLKIERCYQLVCGLIDMLKLNVHKFIFNTYLQFVPTLEMTYARNIINFKHYYFKNYFIKTMGSLKSKRLIALRHNYLNIIQRVKNLCLHKIDNCDNHDNYIITNTGFTEIFNRMQNRNTKLLKALDDLGLILEWRNLMMLNFMYINYLLSFYKINEANSSNVLMLKLGIYNLSLIKIWPKLLFKSKLDTTNFKDNNKRCVYN